MMMVSVIALPLQFGTPAVASLDELSSCCPITRTLGLDWQVPSREPGNGDQRCRRDFRSK
jgi:hypothetical protein